MRANVGCSDEAKSEIVDLFLRRTNLKATPVEVIDHQMENLRMAVPETVPVDLAPYLIARNIARPEFLSDMTCDGYIRPNGSTFSDGFRLFIRAGANEERTRFTIAHEICHTFFYEFASEMKFVPHKTDEMEERLCNYGAAALLMPKISLEREIKDKFMSIQTLEELAGKYRVSLETMFLRLRELGFWNAEISIWFRMTCGDFALDRMYGWRKEDWRWTDTTIPMKAWEGFSGKVVTGRTFIDFPDDKGIFYAKRVFYQAKRRANTIVALWSRTPFPEGMPDLPLFARTKRKMRQRH
jgi:hypothetical protein